MNILVDENIPFAQEAYGRLGEVRVRAGRRIGAADVRDIDVLIVRSVTRIDEALLAGSRVGFVGTATIGSDHVDADYLARRGIAFASAPGSNANSVAEYVVAALLRSAASRGVLLEGSTIAVVGVGNVGRRVVEQSQALGMRCLLNDPPRQRATGDPSFRPLEEALTQADYVTLHVPLERGGPDATSGLAGRAFFEKLRPGTVFLNTSRGEVVDEAALAGALEAGRVSDAILDVWRGEPNIDPGMVRRAFIATPHIAGYSFDGKIAATMMLFEALCRWMNRSETLDLSDRLPAPPVPRVDQTRGTGSDEELLRAAVSAAYDIDEDDRALRHAMEGEAPGVSFDLLRKNYKQRREFRHTTVIVPKWRDTLLRKVTCLGFHAVTE